MLVVRSLILIANVPAFFYGIAKSSVAFATSTAIFMSFSYMSVQVEWDIPENWNGFDEVLAVVDSYLDGWPFVGIVATFFLGILVALPRLYAYFGWLLPGLILFFALLLT